MYKQNAKAERKRVYRTRTSAPIVNVGRLRIDWPTRDHSPSNLLKFAAFILLLLSLFALLYVVQSKWLMSINSRQQVQAPAWK